MKKKSILCGLLVIATTLMSAQSWQIIGDQADMSGLTSSVAISKNNNMIYSAGFLKYGALPANQVFKWDFTEWAPVGNLGLTGTSSISKIVLDNTDKIYSIGDYKDSTGKYYIRFWNGTAWGALGNLKSTTQFRDIATDGQNIYVAGNFVNTATGENCYLTKWDGTSWSVVTASNFSGIINTIVIDSDNNLIVGGEMKNALNQFAIFKIANGMNSEVGKIRGVVPTEKMFLNKANNKIIAEGDARRSYDPSTNIWTKLSQNSGYTVMDYEEAGNYIVRFPNVMEYSQVYVNNIGGTSNIFLQGGILTQDCKFDKFGYPVCGTKGGNMYRWSQKIGGLATNEVEKSKLSVYPNPSTGFVNISNDKKMSSLQIYDVTGKLVKNLSPESKNIKIDLSNHPKGIYLIKSKADNKEVTGKVILN